MLLEPFDLDLPEVETRARMPSGFRAGAMAAGIKASGRPDLGILATTGDAASAAGVFTTNRLPAAPVRLCRDHLAASDGRARAVLATSGCANAATGEAGRRDQDELAAAVASALGVPVRETLALSTGLIGTRLPVEGLRRPLAELATTGLAATDDALAALAEQLCTTDSRPKWASVQLDLPAADDRTGEPGLPVTVTGIAKGVGMVHPRMATMLALLLVDAAATPATLARILGGVVERTWNQLTVDGDTSTNDTVLLLASGAAGPGVDDDPSALALFGRSIEAVARSLARQQAADGEGATTLLTCQASGARDDAEARAVARSVVASSLVKAAVHGRDPNWGRVAAAIGNATIGSGPVAVDEARLAIALCGVPVFAGAPLPFDRAAVAERMDASEVLIRVDLGLGSGRGEAFGCDLSEQYVVENSAYST